MESPGGYELVGSTLTDNESESGKRYNPEMFTMRNLRKPSAPAVAPVDEDDDIDIDDLPFL